MESTQNRLPAKITPNITTTVYKKLFRVYSNVYRSNLHPADGENMTKIMDRS